MTDKGGALLYKYWDALGTVSLMTGSQKPQRKGGFVSRCADGCECSKDAEELTHIIRGCVHVCRDPCMCGTPWD